MSVYRWTAEREGIAIAWAIFPNTDPAPEYIIDLENPEPWVFKETVNGTDFNLYTFWTSYAEGGGPFGHPFEPIMFDIDDNSLGQPNMYVVDGTSGEPVGISQGFSTSPLTASGAIANPHAEIVALFVIDVPVTPTNITVNGSGDDRDEKIGIASSLYTENASFAKFFQKGGNSNFIITWDGGGEGLVLVLEFNQLPT